MSDRQLSMLMDYNPEFVNYRTGFVSRYSNVPKNYTQSKFEVFRLMLQTWLILSYGGFNWILPVC